jgi:hypothetical protein
MPKLIKADVVPWEQDVFGVWIEWSDGLHLAYPVGSKPAAKAELGRMRSVDSKRQLREPAEQ